eukprot:3997793-Pleurochrysis_carterae.AAC.1
MPSGRANGPEKRSRTRRDARAEPRTWSAERTSWGEVTSVPSGKPATPEGKAGCGGTAEGGETAGTTRHGK